MVAGWGVIFRKFDLCTEKQSREKKSSKNQLKLSKEPSLRMAAIGIPFFKFIYVWCVTVRAFYLPEAIFTTVAIPLKIEL